MKPHRIYRHGPAEPLAPDVWRVRGGLPFPVSRNMIVVRLASGGLLLHSAIALNDDGMTALEGLGRPAYAIVPSRYHQRDAPFYKARYPDLMLLCPEKARAFIEPNVRIDGTVEDVLPALGVRLYDVPGLKHVEYIYDVPMPAGGRMLMANDVIGNRGAASGVLGRLLLRPLLVAQDGPAVPRLFRWLHVRDPGAVTQFLAKLASTKDLRLITVSHGDPVTDHPAEKLKALAGEKPPRP